MKTRIHVNQHRIRHNRTTGDRLPVITVKDYKTNRYAFEAAIDGPSRIVYRPDSPLPCGAVLWIETEAKVRT